VAGEGATRRVALVTGASRGIGRCAAIALAERGYDVAITARTVREGEGVGAPSSVRDERGAVALPGSLESTAAEIEALGREALVIPMDLLDRMSVGMALQAVLDAWDRVDVLVNNAIYQGPATMDRFLDIPLDLAAKIVEGNYLNQLALVQKVVPIMLAQDPADGVGTRGVIVNLTSGSVFLDPPAPAGEGGWGLAYVASKAAFNKMVGILHVEFGGQGIRSYNVEPGHVVTESQKARGGHVKIEEAGFRSTPAEVPGQVVAWLTTDDPEAVALAGTVVSAGRTAKQHALVPGWPPPKPA
jgi:NAD(P)-dependent dehydrogenase (short-subunit alcohol dehydrogenase family)